MKATILDDSSNTTHKSLGINELNPKKLLAVFLMADAAEAIIDQLRTT